jgi:uncharacterized protein YdiU (UPF0061 family)
LLINTGKLAEVLAPLLPKESAERILSEYDDIYAGYYESLMAGKFGFSTAVVATEGEAGTQYFAPPHKGT